MNWLRLTLAAQLVFFGVWGARLLTSHDGAAVVWLATKPVDPRDLLAGHYVALRYRIGSSSAAGCEPTEVHTPRTVYVRLEESGEMILTVDGPVAIAEAVGCQAEVPPPAAGERWIAGELGAPGRDEIAYGIERFYVPEGSGLRTAASGAVVAKVAIDDDFAPRLVDLVRTIDPTAPPPE
jgi:uncharacterized membrane-anchored protein